MLSELNKTILKVAVAGSSAHVISKSLKILMPHPVNRIDQIVTWWGIGFISSYLSGQIANGTVSEVNELLQAYDDISKQLKEEIALREKSKNERED